MKLRANKLKPLRFDPTGIFDPKLDLTKTTLLSEAKYLESVRDSLIGSWKEAGDLESDVAFYDLPRRLLLQYGADRHGSELANLFKVANRLHASVDRVVILGFEGTDIGARIFMEGCCQPYWNELSRGDRGSKPRLYFDGQKLDNDATQGLLHVLEKRVGRESTSELDAWGIVFIEGPESTIQEKSFRMPYVRALQMNCGDDLSLVGKRICAITRSNQSSPTAFHSFLEQVACKDVFPAHHSIPIGYSIFTGLGLVPAAILGINVIELLVGAAAAAEQFEKLPAEENIALQIVAANRLVVERKGIRKRCTDIWNHSLQHITTWQNLLSTTEYQLSNGAVPEMVVKDPIFNGMDEKGILFHNVIVEDYRFDELILSRLPGTMVENEVTSTLPVLNRKSISDKNLERKLSGHPTTDLFLPKVDELHLGYFLQLLMISSILETKSSTLSSHKMV